MKLVVVDKHEIFCDGLCDVLKNMPDVKLKSICGMVPNSIELITRYEPDIAIIDPATFESADLISIIQKAVPGAHIIVLTHSEAGADLISAISQGAAGYLPKDIKRQNLIELIHSVTEGGVVIGRPMAGLVYSVFRFIRDHTHAMLKPEEVGALSEQEKEILGFLAKGATNKEIADSLCVSENTVKVHMRNIMRKLHVRNRLEAGIFGLQEGISANSLETQGKDVKHHAATRGIS